MNYIKGDNSEIAGKVGEFLIQMTVLEQLFELLYREVAPQSLMLAKFKDRTGLHKKLRELAEFVDLGEVDRSKTLLDCIQQGSSVNIFTRAMLAIDFRNTLARKSLSFNKEERTVSVIDVNREAILMHQENLAGLLEYFTALLAQKTTR
jgi:hypothetical protein